MNSPTKEKRGIESHICKLRHIRKYYVQFLLNTFENPNEMEEFYKLTQGEVENLHKLIIKA